MAELDRCYRVHLDLSMCEDLAVLIDNVAKIGDLTFIGEKLIVWLNDNKDKKDLIRTLKKAGIKEFFCESIDYSSIGKSENFDFLSSWFMDEYNSYLIRIAEKQNQEALEEMYNNIQRAQALLDNKINEDRKILMTKNFD